MKNIKHSSTGSLIIMCLLLIVSGSCNKVDYKTQPPVILKSAIFSLGSDAVTICSIVKNADEGSAFTSGGICWSKTNNPALTQSNYIDGDLKDTIMFCRIEGLAANTKYYVRTLATNAAGTGYGEEIEFTTNATVTDIESNIYNTVTLGTQVWLVENLKSTKYTDGSDIPVIRSAWSNLVTPGYCWYDYDISNKNIYGALYNWPAVVSQELCPAGWHVPTNSEWIALTDYVGGENIAGKFLKSNGTGWDSPNSEATNYSGFSALPGGASSNTIGSFSWKGVQGFWWSSTIDYSYNVEQGEIINRSILNISPSLSQRGFLSKGGPINFLSVRCIKD